MKEPWLLNGNAIPRFQIGILMPLGLQLVLGGRLYQVHLTLNSGLVAHGHHPLTIRRPISLRHPLSGFLTLILHAHVTIPGSIGLKGGPWVSIKTQRSLLAGFQIFQPEIVILDPKTLRTIG